MLSPSASSARRSRALLRMASAPTRRAGSTMREKPNRSLRWKVTPESYADPASPPAVGRAAAATSVGRRAAAGSPGSEDEQQRECTDEGDSHGQEDLFERDHGRLGV